MQHEITKLKLTHYEESLQLSEYAFQYKVPEEKREDRLQQLKNQDVYCIFDGDTLASKLHLLSLEIWMEKKKFPMGGIAGVATYPEYRRKGHVRSLLTRSLEEMKNKGEYLSMLHPFDIHFYRKFGWEVFAYFEKLSLKKKDLNPFQEVNGFIKRFTKDNYPVDLHELYDQYAHKHNGMMVRTKEWWKERSITDLWVAIYYDKNKLPMGYLSYEVKNEKLKVEEFVPLTPEARNGLWNFICQHDSMIKEAELILNPGEPLSYLLKDPRVKVEKHPYFMSRVVDVEGFLNNLLPNMDFSDSLFLTIKDEHASWNNHTFHVMDQIVKKDTSGDSGAVKMSINTFTALMFGVYSPQEFFTMGQIEGDSKDVVKLEKLTPPSRPFFYDFF
ncbi:GNAT family N-acetyltransferase [Rossellomorea oryzaecorticis]|uniref:GNAT family N-acetyltransferase n=1 Tax=Rossellomorea oryzaecorticis TaxID=1396505 RepID=A0ABU9KAN4_9BACI